MRPTSGRSAVNNSGRPDFIDDHEAVERAQGKLALPQSRPSDLGLEVEHVATRGAVCHVAR